jgi:FkbM family methyltransferase
MVQDWEPWLERFVPASGRTALDIGANIGQWAAYLSPRFASVLSFEPNAELAERIRKMALPNVTVIEKAAWIVDGKVQFHLRGECEFGYATHSAIAARDPHSPASLATIEVEAVALDSMEFIGLDFVKVDIEGAEVNAMMSAARTIETHRPKLLIECHEQEHCAWLRTWLERIGYNVLLIHGPGYEPGTTAWAMHTWLAAEWWK